MKRATLVAALAVVACFVGADGASAAGNEGATCIAAFEDAQRLRTSQRLLAAREALSVCSRATCPKVVAERCQKWKDAVEAAVPTAKLSIVDAAGKPLAGARVTIDDGQVVVPDDGVVTLDPGPHGARAEKAGFRVGEARFELKPGDKDRPVTLRLASVAPIASASASAAPPPEPRAIPTAAYVVGGVGVVAVGAFVVLGLSGKHDENHLASTCSPACSPDDVSSVRTKYVVADVALGVGVAALGVATWLILSNKDETVGLSVGPRGLSLRTKFLDQFTEESGAVGCGCAASSAATPSSRITRSTSASIFPVAIIVHILKSPRRDQSGCLKVAGLLPCTRKCPAHAKP